MYTHTMNTGTFINCFCWAALTFPWLEANRLFFDAISNAINEHNEQIRQKTTVETTVETTVYEDDSEDESEEE